MAVTFQLPAEVVRSIDDTARTENKAPDQVVTEALRTGLPASREAVEARYRAALHRLQSLPDDEFQGVQNARISHVDQARLTDLLEANRKRNLDSDELAELAVLQDRAVAIAAENTIARTLLRDRKTLRTHPG